MFLLLDFPANTKRLSERERQLAIGRLAADNVQARSADSPKITSLGALKQGLGNWRTWILVVGYMVIVGSSTLTYFIPTLVNGLGYTAHKAQYMVSRHCGRSSSELTLHRLYQSTPSPSFVLWSLDFLWTAYQIIAAWSLLAGSLFRPSAR